MDDQDDLLKIGEFSTGWHSHTEVLDAAKWLRDQEFSVFLDKVESVLQVFRRFFELRVDGQTGDFCFCRRSDSNTFANMVFDSHVRLLYLAWDLARTDPKAKMLNEFDGHLIRSFCQETEPKDIATEFVKLSDELAKHRSRLAMHKDRSPRPESRQTRVSIDSQRLAFYENLIASNIRTTYKVAAKEWNTARNDDCDEGAFRQSCYRARQNNDRNKS